MMEIRLRVARIFFILVIGIWLCDGEFIQENYLHKKDLKNIITTDQSAVTVTQTISQCAVLCSAGDSCRSFFFQESTAKCVVFSGNLTTATSKTESGWIYFERKDPCGAGWELYQRYCFYFGDELITWQSAKDVCSDLGAYLAEPIDAVLDQYLINTLITLVGDRRLWLGGSDLVQEGQWMWNHSNIPVTFNHWNPNEPSNTMLKEHCMLHILSGWNDVPCTFIRRYVCQKPAV